MLTKPIFQSLFGGTKQQRQPYLFQQLPGNVAAGGSQLGKGKIKTHSCLKLSFAATHFHCWPLGHHHWRTHG